MSAGVTTCGTPMGSNNWRRRGEADASRSAGGLSCLSFTMVRVILQHRMRAIQLFGEHHPHHRVGEGQRGQRPAPGGLHENGGAESVGPADHETQVSAVL